MKTKLMTVILTIIFSIGNVPSVNADHSVVTNPVFEEQFIQEENIQENTQEENSQEEIIQEQIIQEDTELIITNPMDNNYLEEIDSPIINYTEEEVTLLARVIEAEARGESYEGKVAVGNVVINRVLSDKFSYANSITSVIYAPGQFSTVANGSINNNPSEDSINAAKEVLYRNYDNSNGALYFWATYVPKTSWIWTRTIVNQIGNHYFGK